MQDLRAPAHSDVVGGRYQVGRLIAEGGVGSVYEGTHVLTGQRVALKTLNSSTLRRKEAHVRLLREASVLGTLRHPHIVAVYDAGTCDTHGPFVALEMIEGRSVGSILLTRTVLEVPQAIALTMQVCDALQYVHSKGVVHRDVKPANTMISRTPIGEQVEIIDFGIAKADGMADPDEEKLTQMGALLGTSEYMAPEQLTSGADVDGRADVYATGVMLYEALTGSVPVAGAAIAVVTAHLSGKAPEPVSTLRPEVSTELDAVVAQALAIDPADRFQSPLELAAALVRVYPSVPGLRVLDGARSDPSPKPALKPTVMERPASSGTGAKRPGARRHERAPYVTPVRIQIGDRAVDGRCEDISEGGVLVVVDAACDSDQSVKIRIPLPESGVVATIEGTTRWVRSSRSARAIGVEFMNVPDEIRQSIRKYVSLMSGDMGGHRA